MTTVSQLPLSECLLRQAAEHSLRAFLEPNAIFLAERLHLRYPSDVSANLLATAHLREGNFSQAAQVLHSARSLENRYLYSVCMSRIATPEALREAEAHLRGVHGPIDVHSHPIPSASSTPGGAAGLYLLGTICHRTGRKKDAIELFRRAVEANPTLWVAFEALANMGIVNEAEQILGTQSDAAALDRLDAQPQFLSHPPDAPRRRHRPSSLRDGRPVSAPATSGHVASGTHLNGGHTQLLRSPVGGNDTHPTAFATPSPMPSNRISGAQFDDMMTPSVPLAPAGRHHGARRIARNAASPLNSTTRQGNRRSASALDSHVRNPNDLFATPTSNTAPYANREAVSSMHMTQQSSQVLDPKAPIARTLSQVPPLKSRSATKSRPSSMPTNQQVEESGTMDLLRMLGQIVSELGRFRCTRTLELADRLPHDHQRCGLVLSIRGRALLEKGDYAAAEQEFAKSISLEATRMDGIVEYYSTVLWHLKKEKELAQLAIRAQRVYPVSSSAWCAAGNCFSLRRDPDTALKFFRKAIATSKYPNAYAYTLSGHEHAAKENFEAALASFRQALHIDERHYNAMYGIGQVLQKQEKYVLAQNHFKSAVMIHPLNSTLHYHLGMALAASVNANGGANQLSRGTKHALIPALAEFETAANLDLRNPVPRFEKAKILVAMQRLPDARRQLESLRDTLPRESEVHFELGRVCRKMGDMQSAFTALNTALDIEPKERKYKKALETLSSELEAESVA